MPFTKTFIVKKVGNSKAVYLPADWGVEKNEMMTIQGTLKGKDYITTTKAHFNCSIYLFVPAFWPCSVGDMIDLKVTYANVPINMNTRKRGKNLEKTPGEVANADTGTEN